MTIHFLKKEMFLKMIMAVHRFGVVQFGVELKSLILIRLHSDLVLRDLVVRTTVPLCMSPFQQKQTTL